jgi:hypothetical protein
MISYLTRWPLLLSSTQRQSPQLSKDAHPEPAHTHTHTVRSTEQCSYTAQHSTIPVGIYGAVTQCSNSSGRDRKKEDWINELLLYGLLTQKGTAKINKIVRCTDNSFSIALRNSATDLFKISRMQQKSTEKKVKARK